MTISIPMHRLNEARRSIALANKRLARNGIAERFTFTVTNRLADEEGMLVELADIDLSAPSIALGDYRLSGVHRQTPAGAFISRWAGGADTGAVPTTTDCDHCGANRRRRRVYTLTDADGKSYQIGSNCLELYTGVRPQGLWALQYEVDEELGYLEGAVSNAESHVFEGASLLATTSRILADTAWVPRSKASHEAPATADLVLATLAAGAPEATDEERAEADAVAAWVSSLDSGNDYERNLAAAYTSMEDGRIFVNRRHVALFISALPAYRRDAQRAEAQAAAPQALREYLAPTGTSLKGMGVEAVIVRAFYGEDYGFGSPLHVTMRDDAGHMLYWRAAPGASASVPDAGARLKITGGTVKDTHVNDYDDTFETVLTRVKFETA